MKRVFLFLIIFCLSLCCTMMVCGAEDDAYMVSDEMINILVSNLDNLFPLNSQRERFITPSLVVYSDVGGETMTRLQTSGGRRSIMLIANADGIHEYDVHDGLTKSYPSDFMLTMDVTIDDAYPAGQAGCYVGFTNYGVSAFSDAEGALMIDLVITGQTAELYLKSPESDAGTHISLGELARATSKLSIIHLTGQTYAMINGKLMGQYHDGLKGGFQLIYGAAVFTEGDVASCSFDNMTVRKVSIK